MPRPSRPSALAALTLATALVSTGCSLGTVAGEPAPSSTSPAATFEPSPPDTPVPPSTSGAPTTPATPEGSAGEVREVAPRRTVATREADATYLGSVGEVVVVSSPRGLSGWGVDGERAWSYAAPEGARPVESWLLPAAGVAVLARPVPVGRAPFPGRTRTRVVDATTGAVLWRDDEVSFVSAGEGTVLTTGGCTGDQDGVVGDCTISARDPRTGAVRWSAPTYASAQVSGYQDGTVTVDSYGTGGGDVRTRTFDLATGAALSPFLPGSASPSGDGFLVLDQRAVRRGTSCRHGVRRLDLAGDVVWSRVLRSGVVAEDDGGPCRDLYLDDDVALAGGLVSLSGEQTTPWVLDLATGAVRWRGRPGGRPAAAAGGLLVTSSTSNGYLEATEAVDLRSGETRWTLDAPGDVVEAPGLVVITADRVLVSPGDCLDPCDTRVLDRRTGALVATLRGELVSSGPEGFVTASPGASSGGVTFHFHRLAAQRASRP